MLYDNVYYFNGTAYAGKAFTDDDLYDPELPWDYVLEQEVLLEVKYNQVLPKPISKVLDHENLNRISVSKYAVGRTVLNEWVL